MLFYHIIYVEKKLDVACFHCSRLFSLYLNNNSNVPSQAHKNPQTEINTTENISLHVTFQNKMEGVS
jgi:hypothetical protein